MQLLMTTPNTTICSLSVTATSSTNQYLYIMNSQQIRSTQSSGKLSDHDKLHFAGFLVTLLPISSHLSKSKLPDLLHHKVISLHFTSETRVLQFNFSANLSISPEFRRDPRHHAHQDDLICSQVSVSISHNTHKDRTKRRATLATWCL